MTYLQLITLISSIFFILNSFEPYGSEARTLSAAQFYPQTSYIKRNSWWSKKSLDNLPGNSQGTAALTKAQSGCDSALDVIKCYASDCVTDFVLCMKNAQTNDLFDMCKMEHGYCAARCFGSDFNDRK